MALVRTPFQSDFDRLVGGFFDAPAARGPMTSRRWIPAMDMAESPDGYTLRVDLPGVADEDLAIQFDDGVLTISGHREATKRTGEGGYLRVERSAGQFSRSLRLPEGTDAKAVSAVLDRGVLEVTIPKPEERKPQKIEITVGGQQPVVEAASEPVEKE